MDFQDWNNKPGGIPIYERSNKIRLSDDNTYINGVVTIGPAPLHVNNMVICP